MRRAASHSHQAGEGSAFPERYDEDAGAGQPMDPFEDIPHGVSNEEVGFGSLAFEDRVIVPSPGEARSARRAPRTGDAFARLRLARATARN